MSTIGKEMDHDKGKVHVQGKACDTVRNWFKMSFSLCRTWWRSTSTEWVTLLRQRRLIHESGLCCRTWWTWDKWESSIRYRYIVFTLEKLRTYSAQLIYIHIQLDIVPCIENPRSHVQYVFPPCVLTECMGPSQAGSHQCPHNHWQDPRAGKEGGDGNAEKDSQPAHDGPAQRGRRQE